MGRARSDLFTQQQNAIAAFAKALGHPARVAILQHLFRIEGCFCGDLVEETGLAQPTVSQHLKELKHIGLIRGRVEGPRVCYCIQPENWRKMQDMLMGFLSREARSNEDLCC